jgi:hypothetical protein
MTRTIRVLGIAALVLTLIALVGVASAVAKKKKKVHGTLTIPSGTDRFFGSVTSQNSRCDRATVNLGTGNYPSACWRPFADSAWTNTPLPANPRLLPNGSTYVNYMMARGTPRMFRPVTPPGTDWAHPFFFRTGSSDPSYVISCQRPSRGLPNSVCGQTVKIPCGAMPATGSDHHMAILDQATNEEWDFFNTQTTNLSSCTPGTLTVDLASRVPINGDGRLSCGASAACVAHMAAIIRFPEIQAGHIDHALFLVVHGCNGQAVFPAWSGNGPCAASVTNPSEPAQGQYFQLNPAALNSLPASTSPWQRTVLTAMATYGSFVGDQGANGSFEVMTESPETYRNTTNPWRAWANAGQTNVSWDGSYLQMTWDNFPVSFWTNNLRVVDPCVIAKTCRP